MVGKVVVVAEVYKGDLTDTIAEPIAIGGKALKIGEERYCIFNNRFKHCETINKIKMDSTRTRLHFFVCYSTDYKNIKRSAELLSNKTYTN